MPVAGALALGSGLASSCSVPPRSVSASWAAPPPVGSTTRASSSVTTTRRRIAADLGAGKAAVGVLAKIADAPAIQSELTQLGGTTSSHDVVDEAAVVAG